MTKLKVQVGHTSRRRLADDMPFRNDRALDQEIMTNIIHHTNPMSPLFFFSNVMGGQGSGSEDGMFSVETRGISQEYLKVDEYKTGLIRPARVLNADKVPDTIYANIPFEIECDTPIDEDENVLLRDQKSMLTVRSSRPSTGGATLSMVLAGFNGSSIPKSLVERNAPLNLGYGNSKGEASPNSNTLMTSESVRNVFHNPLVITRYVYAASGSAMANEDVFMVKTVDKNTMDEAQFAINLPVKFFRDTLASLEKMMMYSVGNFDINTLEILGKSRSTRFSDRPSYLGIYQQLDDITSVVMHSMSKGTEKQGLFKIDAALRHIKSHTGGRPVVAAICRGVGAQYLRHLLRTEIESGSKAIGFMQEVKPENRVLPVGYQVKEYISDHGTMIIYDMDDALLEKNAGAEFDKITFNGMTSDMRSQNIYFVPLTKTVNGKRTKRARYFYKETDSPQYGKVSRAFVFGQTRGITGQGNNITADQAFGFQEDAIGKMMSNSGNRLDSTVDANEYHILTHGVPYINVDDAYRMILVK